MIYFIREPNEKEGKDQIYRESDLVEKIEMQIYEDIDVYELVDIFKRFLLAISFPPDVVEKIQIGDDE